MLTRTVIYVARKKEIASAGLRSIWKGKKYFILESMLKPLILSKIEIFGTANKKIYLTDRCCCIEHVWQIYEKIGHSDPIYVTQLGHLICFSQVSLIYQAFNDLHSSVTYEDGKNPSDGNACGIHEMEIHGLFMCIWRRL